MIAAISITADNPGTLPQFAIVFAPSEFHGTFAIPQSKYYGTTSLFHFTQGVFEGYLVRVNPASQFHERH
jgi:hypothetical protein